MGGKLLTPVDVVKAEWVSRGGDREVLSAPSRPPPAPSSLAPTSEEELILDPQTNTTYLKGKFLGKGGFARVHELTDLTTSQVFACKIVPKSRLTRPHHRQKILREVELHGRLRHPNVVRFHRFFEDERHVYLLLENCSNKSLLQVLRERGRLPEGEARALLSQAAEGLGYLHRGAGVVHRDLKPANLLLALDGRTLKIADFGLATDDERHTSNGGNVCGTPNYIAPEVLNLQGHGFPADVWALGCITYALLVGRPPFETRSLQETYRRICCGRYSLPPSLSTPARHLIARLLHPNPADRPQAPHGILQQPFFTGDSCEPSEEPKEVIIPKSETPKRTEEDSSSSGHCFPTSFKQKITSALCPDKMCKKAPKEETTSSATLLQLLQSVLDTMPEGGEDTEEKEEEGLVSGGEAFVSKWVDYSNKYGFAFQLSDRSVGAVFNDASRMGQTAKHARVEFLDGDGRSSSFSPAHVPAHLKAKFTLFQYFAEFMDENLSAGGEPCGDSPLVRKRAPMMRRWLRTPSAVVMQLNSGTLQINFFKDHSKLVLSAAGVLTQIDARRRPKRLPLQAVAERGCPTLLRMRLRYAASLLADFARLEE